MLMKSVLVALLGAGLCLDRVCLQFMISRPVVVAPVTGLALGDFQTGLIVGAIVELLWVDRPAVGSYVPPNDSILAVIITGAAILAAGQIGGPSQAFLAFSLLLLLPLAVVTQKIDIFLMNGNNALSDAALKDAERGDVVAVKKRHLTAIVKTFAVFAIAIFLMTFAGGLLLARLYPLLPATALTILHLVFFAFPFLIVAIALNSIQLRWDIPVFCALFAAAFLFFRLFHGI